MHFSKATLFIQQIFTKDLLFVRHCSCTHTHTQHTPSGDKLYKGK